jgi:hypothetical protein
VLAEHDGVPVDELDVHLTRREVIEEKGNHEIVEPLVALDVHGNL